MDKAKELEIKANELEAKVKSYEEKLAANIGSGMANNSNSFEQQTLRTFGCKDLSELINVNTCSPRFARVSNDTKQSVINLKKDIDIARWMHQFFEGGARDSENSPAALKFLEGSYAKSMDLASRIKSFSSGGATTGANWIPTALSSNYIEEFLLERVLVDRFQKIPMSSNPYELPTQSATTTARIVGEGAAVTDTNFQTNKLTFTAKKLAEYYLIPEELDQDSAPAILDIGRQAVLQAQVNALEIALLAGDTTGTHMDSDVTASDDARKQFKGLRKLALANGAYGSLDFGSAITTPKLDSLKKLMKKFGVHPKDLLIVVSASGYSQMVALDEVSTYDKFGPMATIGLGGGVLEAWRGIPIITSEYVRDDLNAFGVYDGVTTDNTVVHMVNVRRFLFGQRQPIRVIFQRDPRAEYDRSQLVSYQRIAFSNFAQSATEASCVLGYNVTV